jgi:hypothetical protein
METPSPDSGMAADVVSPPVIPPISAPSPEIAKAVVLVMGQAQRLEQTERNAHGNYKFASIDGFLDMMRPLLAGQELAPAWQQVECKYLPAGPGDKNAWIYLRCHFYLLHTGGTIWGPFERSVMCMMLGSQSFGSAQSYALKQWLRAQFMLSTGDKEDADFNPQEFGSNKQQKASRGQGQKPPQQRQAAPPSDKASPKALKYMMTLWTQHEKKEENPIPPEALKEWCQKKFNVQSRTDLKKDQVSFIIEVLTKKDPRGEIETFLREANKEKAPEKGQESDK